MQRVTTFIPAGAESGPVSGHVELTHDARHLRRKALKLADGGAVMLDLKEAVLFAGGDRLVLEDGAQIEIVAAPEELYEIRARDGLHIIELAWHLGNRHLPAQIETDRILILRDHVIRQMLNGLGATVREIVAPFQPVRGAYHGDHHHDHGHGDHDHHGHHHHHD